MLGVIQMYAIYDLKAECYLRPFFCENAAEARRAWIHVCGSPDDVVARFAEDFELHEVASFELETGVIVAANDPMSLRATEFASAARVVPGLQRDLGVSAADVELPLVHHPSVDGNGEDKEATDGA